MVWLSAENVAAAVVVFSFCALVFKRVLGWFVSNALSKALHVPLRVHSVGFGAAQLRVKHAVGRLKVDKVDLHFHPYNYVRSRRRSPLFSVHVFTVELSCPNVYKVAALLGSGPQGVPPARHAPAPSPPPPAAAAAAAAPGGGVVRRALTALVAAVARSTVARVNRVVLAVEIAEYDARLDLRDLLVSVDMSGGALQPSVRARSIGVAFCDRSLLEIAEPVVAAQLDVAARRLASVRTDVQNCQITLPEAWQVIGLRAALLRRQGASVALPTSGRAAPRAAAPRQAGRGAPAAPPLAPEAPAHALPHLDLSVARFGVRYAAKASKSSLAALEVLQISAGMRAASAPGSMRWSAAAGRCSVSLGTHAGSLVDLQGASVKATTTAERGVALDVTVLPLELRPALEHFPPLIGLAEELRPLLVAAEAAAGSGARSLSPTDSPSSSDDNVDDDVSEGERTGQASSLPRLHVTVSAAEVAVALPCGVPLRVALRGSRFTSSPFHVESASLAIEMLLGEGDQFVPLRIERVQVEREAREMHGSVARIWLHAPLDAVRMLEPLVAFAGRSQVHGVQLLRVLRMPQKPSSPHRNAPHSSGRLLKHAPRAQQGREREASHQHRLVVTDVFAVVSDVPLLAQRGDALLAHPLPATACQGVELWLGHVQLVRGGDTTLSVAQVGMRVSPLVPAHGAVEAAFGDLSTIVFAERVSFLVDRTASLIVRIASARVVASTLAQFLLVNLALSTVRSAGALSQLRSAAAASQHSELLQEASSGAARSRRSSNADSSASAAAAPPRAPESARAVSLHLHELSVSVGVSETAHIAVAVKALDADNATEKLRLTGLTLSVAHDQVLSANELTLFLAASADEFPSPPSTSATPGPPLLQPSASSAARRRAYTHVEKLTPDRSGSSLGASVESLAPRNLSRRSSRPSERFFSVDSSLNPLPAGGGAASAEPRVASASLSPPTSSVRAAESSSAVEARQVSVAVEVNVLRVTLSHQLRLGDVVDAAIVHQKALRLYARRSLQALRNDGRAGGAGAAAPAAVNVSRARLPVVHVVSVRASDILLSLQDDPREVQFELLSQLRIDEQNQSEARERVLEQRIEELERTQTLRGDTVQKFRESLAAANVAMYIKRAREIVSEGSVKTCLAQLAIEDLAVQVTHDSRVDKQRLVVHMDSAPVDVAGAVEFDDVLGANIDAHLSAVFLYLREYPLPLFSADAVHASGPLVLAEQATSEPFVVYADVRFGEHTVQVPRTMTPMKLYQGLQVRAIRANVSFGQCYMATLRDLSACVTRLTPSSVNPSPPLPWWDKVRLMLHGSVSLTFEELTVMLLPMRSPFDKTEYFRLSVDNLHVSNRRGMFDFQLANLVASQFPSAVEGEPPLLDVPDAHVIVYVKWQTSGASPYHHYVFTPGAPAAPLPTDTFADFRAGRADIKVEVQLKPMAGLDPTVALALHSFQWLARMLRSMKSPNHVHQGKKHGYPATPNFDLDRLLDHISVEVVALHPQVQLQGVANRHMLTAVASDWVLTLSGRMTAHTEDRGDRELPPRTVYSYDGSEFRMATRQVEICRVDPAFFSEAGAHALFLVSADKLSLAFGEGKDSAWGLVVENARGLVVPEVIEALYEWLDAIDNVAKQSEVHRLLKHAGTPQALGLDAVAPPAAPPAGASTADDDLLRLLGGEEVTGNAEFVPTDVRVEMTHCFFIDFFQPEVACEAGGSAVLITSDRVRIDSFSSTNSERSEMHWIIDQAFVKAAPAIPGGPWRNKSKLFVVIGPCPIKFTRVSHSSVSNIEENFRGIAAPNLISITLPELTSACQSEHFYRIIEVFSNVVFATRPQVDDIDEGSVLYTPLVSRPALEMANLLRMRLSELRTDVMHLQDEMESLYPSSDGSQQQQVLQFREMLRRNLLVSELNAKRAKLESIVVQIKKLLAPPDLVGTPAPLAKPVRQLDFRIQEAMWRLCNHSNEEIGVLRFEDISLAVITNEDGSSQSWIAVRFFSITNSQKHAHYKESFFPLDAETDATARLYYKRSPPVGGIPMYDHIELTTAPVAVRLTADFVTALHEFFLPSPESQASSASGAAAAPSAGAPGGASGAAGSSSSGAVAAGAAASSSSLSAAAAAPTLYTSSELCSIHEFGMQFLQSNRTLCTYRYRLGREVPDRAALKSVLSLLPEPARRSKTERDVRAIRNRARWNVSFSFVKLGQIEPTVSFKGSKEKNLSDFENFELKIQPLVYMQRTCAWREIVETIRKDIRSELIAQAARLVKFKIGGVHPFGRRSTDTRPEEDNSEQLARESFMGSRSKTKLLLGDLAPESPTEPARRSTDERDNEP